MDPAHKILIDEIDCHFPTRIDGLESTLQASTELSSACLDALESAARSFDEWRPGVDGVSDDLRIEVKNLSSPELEVSKVSKYMEHTMVEAPTPSLGVFGATPAAALPIKFSIQNN